jgi:hypothetical protein
LRQRGEAQYYYSDKLKIDPAFLISHEYGSLSFIYSKTEAVPLKIINKYDDITIVMVARDINRMALPDSIFSLDKKWIKKKY